MHASTCVLLNSITATKLNYESDNVLTITTRWLDLNFKWMKVKVSTTMAPPSVRSVREACHICYDGALYVHAPFHWELTSYHRSHNIFGWPTVCILVVLQFAPGFKLFTTYITLITQVFAGFSPYTRTIVFCFWVKQWIFFSVFYPDTFIYNSI